MKAKHVILYLLLAIVSSSCIREEALNAEADILSCALPGVAMTTSPIINNNSITIFVGPGTDISELTPEFTLTPGATINPLSGTERNFNTPQEYTVTAADGVWKKTYIISVIDTELATNYNFEDTLGGKKYYIFVEREGDKVVMEWASGNAGYAMTGVAKTADDYPTFQITDGKAGKCLSLVTRSTGFFGQLAGMPIAAGNLFLGSFDVNNAVQKPLKATRFGLPFGKKPLQLKGYYKYTPGTQPFKAKDKNGNTVTIPGQEDEGDIYAVLYEAAELDGKALDGNNVLTSENIVALARVEVEKKDEFTAFHVDFHYGSRIPIDWPKFIQDQRDPSDDGTAPYLSFSEEKMKNYEYNLAVVFTSSKYGAYFAGSVGSTLCIDKVEIVCEK